MSKLIDLCGVRFGEWTVLRLSDRVKVVGKAGRSTKRFWFCRCDCGVEREVPGDSLRTGDSRSCGCTSRERCAAKLASPAKSANPREYRIWQSMKSRCHYPDRAGRYAERGITVCDRWFDSFEDFLADMGPCPSPIHSIDRIDNKGNYEPGNCRWATPSEQSRNQGRNHLITVDGITRPLCDWAAERGLRPSTVQARIGRYGWTAEKALGTSPRSWGR